jgi:predicted metal-dependent phosphoesterase TrpH
MINTEKGKFYRYELHCHDKLCSKCAHNLPEEMVHSYIEAGYDGMVFTNHFLRGNTAVDKSLPWKEKMEAYYNSYLRALNSVTDDNFNVFFGIEHNYGHGKEVLTYGIDLDFLVRNPDIDQLPLSEYTRLVREYGGFVSQAHPFRHASFIDPDVMPEPENLDAMETYNFFNTPEENQQAHEFAIDKGLYETSGADVHDYDCPSIGMAGMAFPYRIKTSGELVKALKAHDGKRIIKGIIE